MSVPGEREKRWAVFERKLRERGLAKDFIPKAARSGGPLSASFAQERLVFLEQLTPGRAAYNDHYALQVGGRLDPKLLSRVLDEIASRHETLRTTFTFGQRGEPLQVVHGEMKIALSHSTWDASQGSFESWVLAEGVREAQTPFDLALGPLARARLLTRAPDQHVLFFTIHHAVWDGWSSGVFAHEISALYRALATSRPSPLPPLETQYADYAEWQRQRLTGESWEQKAAFWKNELEGAPAAIDLPSDRPRPPVQTFAGKTLVGSLGRALSARIDAHARVLGRTPFAVLFATFSVLLARYSGERDLVIATPIANRGRVELESLIGCFVNTLPIRVELTGEPSLSTLVRQISDRLLRAEPHQDLPFEKLIEVLDVERDLSRNPIAQIMFVLQNTPPRALEIEGLKFAPLSIDAGFAKLDLTLNVLASDDGYATFWEYNTDLFDEATVSRMLVHYAQLLEQLLVTPDAPVFGVDLLTQDERRLLKDWNQTAAEPAQEATIHAWFEKQAASVPQAIAVVVGQRQQTYSQLAAHARAVAHALRERGVAHGDLVGVFLERDQHLIPALLGVLMAGAAYVPLDPAYPQERVGLILDDTQARVVISSASLLARLPSAFHERTLDVASLDACDSAERAVSEGAGSDRAYVIYTSGSTGRPKGVEIEHRNALAFIAWSHAVFDPEQLRGVLAATSICFDLSTFEIFATLLAGGCVIVADNALALLELNCSSEVTLINTVPSAAAELLRSNGIPPSVRTVNLAGEPLGEDLVLGLYALPHVERVYNLYGPSETTTYSTFTLTTPKSWRPNIGRPISGTRAHVLDEQLKPVPVGVRGELYLAGAGVARGYLNRPELTAQRFLPDLFADAQGGRMYKTGDVVRWLSSGELEYLGRNDQQIKLRGFRIELGEIESALRRQADVMDAVALVREDKPGKKALVGYVVACAGQRPAIDQLRTALGAALPEYMVPAQFVMLDQLPLSPNGKVDRRRLPPPVERDESQLFVSAQTGLETTLARIWQEVLQVERVGLHHNFFELGGDSISAMRMSALARRAGIELSVSQIFQAATLQALAGRLALISEVAEAKPLPAEPFPLSPIQRWFFERNLAHPNHYNQSLRVELRPDVELADLERAVVWTIARHSALRLVFEPTEQGFVQRYEAEPRVSVRRYDARTAMSTVERMTGELEATLDFERGPLGHVALFEAPEGEKALFVVLHHLVVDVVSWHVLLGDIAAAYKQLRDVQRLPVGSATSHYAEYVEQLANYAALPTNAAAVEAWLRCELDVPRLPRDFAGTENLTASRDSFTWSLAPELTTILGQRARQSYNLGIEDVTLTALALALCGWSKGTRIVIDVEKHGRDLPGLDLTDSVGWFTALFPLAFVVPEGARAALLAIKSALHDVPERARLFQALRYGGPGPARRHLERLDPREVVFNFLGSVLEVADQASPFARAHASSAAANHHPLNERSHLLEVTAAIKDGALDVAITFSRKIHGRATIARLMQRFSAELETLLSHLQDAAAGGFTPADFPLARLNQAELDAQHARWWSKVDDVYRLTPAQHAILVDVLRDPTAGYYVPQLHAVVATLDARRLEQSLAHVVQRHSALRSGIFWSGLEQPVQAVFSRVECPVSHQDWRGDEEDVRRQRLATFMAHDRIAGFVLEQAPLLRLLHVRWTDEQDLLAWTIHHVISDGWSLPIIIGEVLASYAALTAREQPRLRPARAFREYVAWLGQQDQAQGEAYFSRVLRGVSPLELGLAEDVTYRNVIEPALELDSGTARALEQLAIRHSVTLGVVIQAAWAVVLARYGARADVVFGSVDSGRPEALEGASETVGMFVTTLPLRVTVDDSKPLAALFQAVQDASLGIREHAYVALARVTSAAATPRLFQSICVIENYPSLLDSADPLLQLTELGSVEITRFPLTVTATTRGAIKLAVSASLTDASAGHELLEAWRGALEQMASDIVRVVGEVDVPQAARRRNVAEYWLGELEAAPATRLPVDRPRSLRVAPTTERAAFEAPISELAVGELAALAQGLETRPSIVLLGVFAILVSRYVAEPEVLLAVEAETARCIPIRSRLDADMTFAGLVRQLDRRARSGVGHFDPALLGALADRVTIGLSALALDGDEAAPNPTVFELMLRIRATSGGQVAAWDYDPSVFEQATIARLSRHFRSFVEAVVSRPNVLIRQVGFSEAVGPVGEWGVPLPTEATVLDLFRSRVMQAPDAVAVLSETTQLTYAQLDAQSDAAAARLNAHGVTAGDVVAVKLHRSPLLPAVLLAVAKAGAAFMAIDPVTPEQRVRFMLQDCVAKVCVVDHASSSEATSAAALEAAGLVTLENAPGAHADNRPRSGDLAYLIYTSGSTGSPKGVMVEHASLLNYMAFYGRVTHIGPGDRLLQFASASFDVSIEEVFGALCHGAALVLRSDDITPRGLLDACQAQGLTILSLPTAYWNELTRSLAAGAKLPGPVRLVIIGGERATGDGLSRWQRQVEREAEHGARRVRLLNMYGPTEATISATFADLTQHSAPGEPPIGRPVAGAIALVVDANGQPVPVGVPGELLLGGRCLARGYLNRPDLTAEKFSSSPFVGGRVYHTGDLVRWRADEQLEYLGRIDQQVKLRGFRIELGEIESLLRAQPDVEDVVVVLRDSDTENPCIVAYVVGKAPPKQLKAALQALPAYMVPTAFVALEKLPVTRSGKIDKRGLPAPDTRSQRTGQLAPRTTLEAGLLDIWQRVLGIDRLGIDDHFFELGGHSLLATQVVSRIRSELGLEVSVRDLFEAPTVERLGERLHGGRSSTAEAELRSRGSKTAPLSFAQTRLWFLDQMAPGSAAYNMPTALRISGRLNVASLSRALSEVVRRHASLRTVFDTDPNGQPRQRVVDASGIVLERAAAPSDTNAQAWLLEEVRVDAGKPFDLAKGPLIRARLLTLESEQHVLILNMHHIVSDGWSIGILVRELGELYRAFAAGAPSGLADPAVQYPDYASWQREHLTGALLDSHLDFWKAELAGAPLRLELPRKPRVVSASYAGALVRSSLDLPLAERIEALALELAATPFIVLLAAWAVLLSRITGQAELLIGTPVANRNRVDTENLIGLFVNALAIRADLRHDPTFAGMVAQLRERLLRAHAHAELPFEKLVDALQPDRDAERSPIFQVMFVLQNTPEARLALDGLELAVIDAPSAVAKFDITFNAERTAHGYATSWEYRSDFFEDAFMRRLTRHFEHLLHSVLESPGVPCSRASLLSADERRSILDWHQTEIDYPEMLTHELIAAQAKRSPHAVAVLDEVQRLSYRELDEQAHQLALRLVARGVRLETRIAVTLERDVRLIVALLAVQKAGAVYVPLDPALPKNRLLDIFADAHVDFVLTHTTLVARIPSANVELICVDGPDPERPSSDQTLPRPSPESLAYVLFTSGSTGRPKGVEVTHGGLVNTLLAMKSEIGITAHDIGFAGASLSFDMACAEIYVPLISGASLYVATREVAADGQRMIETLQAQRVTFLQATPSTHRMLLAANFQGSAELKLVAAGEQLPLDLAERLLPRCRALWNGYGPTETTIYSHFERVTKDRLALAVTIGKPIPNTQAYVLDPNLEPVPIGVLGELYLAGAGVARGYASRSDLTAERFVPNPFGLGRLYRSGDIVRYLDDGTLEYFGRGDQQIKLRGFRIELGEIEQVIRRYPGIADVAVVLQAQADDRRLVAYLVSSLPVVAEGLVTFLKESLPDYMIPAHFVQLQRLPTTTSGKLDRQALPKASSAVRDHRIAPRNPSERVIATAFEELLHVPEVGVFDNFFELGGHSLLATELVFRLHKELGVKLAVKALFEAPSVAALAEMVRAPRDEANARLPEIVVLARRGVGAPWFCFPALAGTPGPYLSKLSTDAGPPVYLLEAPGLNGGTPLTKVDALARAFADAIRRVAPSGPLRFLGWSFGAMTAFSTARLLADEGRAIEELVLLDPALPGTSLIDMNQPNLAATFIKDIAESLGKLSALTPLWQARAVIESKPVDLFDAARELGIFPATWTLNDFENRLLVYTAGAEALQDFAPSAGEVYTAKASILAASAGNGQQTACWERFLTRASFRVLDADHYTILEQLRDLLR